MASPNWVLVIIQFSILTHLSFLTITHGDSQCANRGYYTQNSAYEKNLNEALYALAEVPDGVSFFSKSSNSSQDNYEASTVYTIVLCPGEFEPESCRACVRSARDRLRNDCPNQKQATAWYYSTCMVSYSNRSFDMGYQGDDIDVFYSPSVEYTNSVVARDTMENLLKDLRFTASSEGFNETFYYGTMGLLNRKGTMQATTQCIPNITDNTCDQCLVNATEYLRRSYDGSDEGVVYYRYSCWLRYEIYLARIGDTSPPMPRTNPPSSPLPDIDILAGKKQSKVIVPAVATAAVILAILTLFICLKVRRMIYDKKGDEEELFEASDDDNGEIIYFRLNAMEAATSNFSDSNKLGEGGFGPVYWGVLVDGKKVAVKRLSQNSSQGMQEFKTEVKLIIKLQQKNLVKLLGCCMNGKERLLVYEFMSNNSLDKYLFDPKKAKELDWPKRVNIVNGIAKGLRYLHEDSRLRIIHRDLKASNILLDEEMNPKISDFGTARIFGSSQVEANTDRVVGTYGYMAPEYAMEGLFSIKSDVYSFGVLLLEIISGKKNGRLFYEEHDKDLKYYAWMLWKEGSGYNLIDETLNDDCCVDEALKWLRIALLCIQEDPNDRPTMSSINFMLEGEWKSFPDPKTPMSFGQFITLDISLSTCNGEELGFYSPSETFHNGKFTENKGIGHPDV